MEFTVFTNDEKETKYLLAPGEILFLSEYGQLLILNKIDNSIAAIPKQGKYVIVFESEDDLPLSATMRLVY